MTDDDLLRAYLDDEVTVDERARVEGDPALLSEVDRLLEVSQRLADLEPPSIATREIHLAAALDAWDRLPAGERLAARDAASGADVATVAAASATTLTRPRLRQRLLIGAAATLVVLLGAGVVLQRINPRDNDDAPAAAETADDTDANAAAGADAASESADAPADKAGDNKKANRAEDAGSPEPADAGDLVGEDIQTESEAIEELESVTDGDAEASHSRTVDEQGPPAEVDTTSLPDLQSADDLLAFAAPVLAVTDTTVVLEEQADDTAEGSVAVAPAAAPTLPECTGLGIDVRVGSALYKDTVVIVGVDRDGGRVIAYDPTNCAPVESLPIPD